MIDIAFRETREPLGVSVEFYIAHTSYRMAVTTVAHHLTADNGKRFFENAKYALTDIAMHLAEVQEKLIEQDRKDCEKAMLAYTTQNAPSSFRAISAATSELVHGKSVRLGRSNVLVDIEPFDVTVGKAGRGNIASKYYTAKDYRINFLDVKADSKEHGPGTKLILENLQNSARIIEKWYEQRFNTPAFAALNAADQANGTGKAVPVAQPKGLPLTGTVIGDTLQLDPDPVKSYQDYMDKMQIVPPAHITQQNVKYETKLSRENADKLIREISKPHQPELRYVKLGDYLAEAWLLQESGGQIMAVPIKGLDYSMEYSISGDEVLNICRGEISTSGSQVVEEIKLASTRSSNSKNPAYWAHALEDKVNGVLQQMKQNLPDDDSTRSLASQISDLLSDHIYALGSTDEPAQ